MNLPNIITLLRIMLVPVFLLLLIYDYYGMALGVFIVAGMTDAVDGTIARMMNQQTELGMFLDPIADKFLVLTAFIALALMDKLPLWLAETVIVRDAVIVAGSLYLYKRGFKKKIKPVLLGKLTTFMLITLLVVALVGVYLDREFDVKEYLVWLTAALLITSGIQYLFRGYRIMHDKKNNLAG
jgi:cardiolipin synthase (CMP-forming)